MDTVRLPNYCDLRSVAVLSSPQSTMPRITTTGVVTSELRSGTRNFSPGPLLLLTHVWFGFHVEILFLEDADF
jgi:hypothetical protein